jgi:hypothetical protein
MACLAGLGLLTRVSTALGLYFATGLLILVLAWPATGAFRDQLSRFVRGLASSRTFAGLAILVGFAAVYGLVNYYRWGDPFAFSGDPSTYIHLMAVPERVARLKAYGVFNIERHGYGSYLFLS